MPQSWTSPANAPTGPLGQLAFVVGKPAVGRRPGRTAREPQRHAHPARTARLWPGRFYIRRVGSARSSDLPAHQRGAGRAGGGAWLAEGAEDTSEKFRPHGGVLSPLHPEASLPTGKA